MNPQQTAEEKLGIERADELRTELEQLQSDLERLHAVVLEIDDEP